MQENTAEAELKFEELNKNTKLHEEFNKLRPKPYSAIIGLLVVYVLGWTAEVYFDANYVTFPLLAFIVYLVVKTESEITHRRIDILFKMLEKQNKYA